MPRKSRLAFAEDITVLENLENQDQPQATASDQIQSPKPRASIVKLDQPSAEDKSSTKKFSQEQHPRKSGFKPSETQDTQVGQQDRFQNFRIPAQTFEEHRT